MAKAKYFSQRNNKVIVQNVWILLVNQEERSRFNIRGTVVSVLELDQ